MRQLGSSTVEWEFTCCRILPSTKFQPLFARVTVTFSYVVDYSESAHPPVDPRDFDAYREATILLWDDKILTPYSSREHQDLFPDQFLKNLDISSERLVGLNNLPTTGYLASIIADQLLALTPQSIYQIDLTFWDSADTSVSITTTRSPSFRF
jgi:hypothetical protein